MKKPDPQEYNISDIIILEKKYNKYRRITGTICGLLVFILALLHCYKHVGWIGIFPAAVIAGFGQAMGYGLYKLLSKKIFKNYCEYITAVEKYESWFIRTQQEFWNCLSGRVFEYEVANLFRKHGYKAEVTPHSKDKGVDIILNDSILVQCKAHKSCIHPAVAREFYGTLKHFKAYEGILVSLNGFSPGAIEFVQKKNIKLMDMSNLIVMQKELDS